MRTIVVVLTVCGLARLGHTDPDDPPVDPVPVDPATVDPATALFEEGRALLAANQPGPACEKFEASLHLEPEALGTILNLGLCTEQLDKIATSLRWFRRVQVRASELQKPDAEAAAKEKAGLLAARVPTIKIAFSHPPPAGIAVAIDGNKVEEIDFNRVEVDAGSHEVTATPPNVAPTHETVTIADGETRTVTIAIAPPPPPPPPPSILIDRGVKQRRQAYLLGGVGVGLLIADTGLALLAKREFDDTDVRTTRDHYQNVARYGATTLFVAGGVAIGTAIYLYLRAPGIERVEQAMVLPVVGSDQLGFAVSKRF